MTVYWIKSPISGKIGTMPKPRGGDWLEVDIDELKKEGTNLIVSLLTKQENVELGLLHEESFCKNNGLEFVSFPINDREVPDSMVKTKTFVEQIKHELHHGKNIAIHCRAGIGRASLIAASILCSDNMSVDEAFERITNARGLDVPDTPEQIEWVEKFINYLKSPF